ncbi:uncharacterized protein [Mytilus edulis]|uniref:uncharacterized protein n=1 Tax=Mytilus edulis TaxID=6550 RepID=UPI0039EFB98D
MKILCCIVVFFVGVHGKECSNTDLKSRLDHMEQSMNNRLLTLEASVVDQKNENVELKRTIANLTKEITKLTQNTSTQKRGKRLLMSNPDQGDRIAFYASMSRSEPVQRHRTLVFDNINVNYGHGYNNNTGTFTAPKSCVYILTFSIHSSSKSYTSADIIVNNESVGRGFTDSSEAWDLNSATIIAVAWMNQGDVSFVRTSPDYNSTGTLYSDYMAKSSFAGWKIAN